jgi:hypothetical protein
MSSPRSSPAAVRFTCTRADRPRTHGAPTITNGAQIVYFHAGTEREIYTSHRLPNGIFDVPTAVTELDATGLRDAAPFVLQTDDYMIFERDYDIFETTR